jgi:hypothetical protein
MPQRCISRQSNFGVEKLTDGILMSPAFSPAKNANRNGNRLPATSEHPQKRTADYLAAKEGFVIRQDGRVADRVKLCQRSIAFVH